MVTKVATIVKTRVEFPLGWTRTYPEVFELVPTDALAQESGAWDRSRENPGRFAETPAGRWVEQLGGVPYASVEYGYLAYVAGLGHAESGNIRVYLGSAAGAKHKEDARYRRRTAQYAANAAEREGEIGAGDGFVLGDSKSGFSAYHDDTPDDGFYTGARWLQKKTTPDFDPSPWTVTGMAVRSRGDLKFKGSNLLPIEGRGDSDRDWEPAPWQAYGFLKAMKASGNTGWLTVRKSGPGVRAAVEVTVERTTKVQTGVARTITVDVTPSNVGEASVRVGHTLAPVYKSKSVDGTVELPGQWGYRGQDADGKPLFYNRHHWDAVLAGATALRSLYHALTERGLTAFADAQDPRQACCTYAADVWAGLPTEAECKGDRALLGLRATVGKVADMVVTLAAQLADAADRPVARDEIAPMAKVLRRFFHAFEAKLQTSHVRGLFQTVTVDRPNADVAVCY